MGKVIFFILVSYDQGKGVTPALEFLLPRASELSRKGSLCTWQWQDGNFDDEHKEVSEKKKPF